MRRISAHYASVGRSAFFPLLHLGLLFVIYQLLVMGGFIQTTNLFFLKQYDAYWYASIAESGYRFSETEPSNVAFFPVFPYIWKILWKVSGAGVEGVCLYNYIVFVLGMLVLKKTFRFSWMHFLFFSSIPSIMFMYVPYSEATFFFFSAVLLAGLKSDNKKMFLVGLFFASLTRPSAAFFIPAVILMELLSFSDLKNFIKNCLLYCAVPILAVLLVLALQYHATGVWLAFFKDGWRREIGLPDLPFSTWGGFRVLWLDGLALFFGLLTICMLCLFVIRRWKRGKIEASLRAEIFSMVHVALSLALILFFGNEDVNGGTSLMSLNRFLMATPFFTVTLIYFMRHVNVTTWTVVLYVSVALLTLLLLNFNGKAYSGYKAEDKIWYAVLVITLFLSYGLASDYFKGRFLPALYIINLFIQVIILHQFSFAKWIG